MSLHWKENRMRILHVFCAPLTYSLKREDPVSFIESRNSFSNGLDCSLHSAWVWCYKIPSLAFVDIISHLLGNAKHRVQRACELHLISCSSRYIQFQCCCCVVLVFSTLVIAHTARWTSAFSRCLPLQNDSQKQINTCSIGKETQPEEAECCAMYLVCM